MKVRVIQDMYDTDCYNVEVKRWYYPFWVEVAYAYNKDTAIEKAKLFADTSKRVVWEQ